MKLTFLYSKRADIFFKKHPEIKENFITRISAFAKGENADIKVIVGSNNPRIFRIRLGKYCVIFFINENGDLTIINVVDVNSRGDIY